LTQGRIKAGLLFCALAALLIAPASAGAVNPVSFSQVGNLTTPREYPGAARLPDGRILVVGGYDDGDSLNTAEIFDPKTNAFSPLGATMGEVRYAPAVAALRDGRVLVAGGWDNNTGDLASAEVFNPSTGSFSPVGSMAIPREEAGAALLPDGRVLVVGGYDDGDTLNSTEIFDPNTNAFSPGPTLPHPTYGPAAAVISGGQILIAGGYDNDTGDYLSSAFVFSPSGNAFSPVGSLPGPTWAGAAASLPQGRALVAGGQDDFSPALTRAVIFDPATNGFSSTGIGNLIQARDSAAAATLADGRVLVAGGDGETGAELNTAEVLSVPSNAFTAKLKGRKVKFAVTNEGVAQVTDVKTQVVTTAAKKKKKKLKLVKTTSKHGGPGKIVVKIKLTKKGAAKLAQKGKLRVRVVYTPDQGLSATKKLKLRAGKK
jgi:hypothetical protein